MWTNFSLYSLYLVNSGNLSQKSSELIIHAKLYFLLVVKKMLILSSTYEFIKKKNFSLQNKNWE